jgi:hypothetical protein
MAIMCANMLTYRPLLPKRILPSRISSWLSSLLPSRRSTKQSSEANRYAHAWPGFNNLDKNGEHGASLTFLTLGPESENEDREYPLNTVKVSRNLDVV